MNNNLCIHLFSFFLFFAAILAINKNLPIHDFLLLDLIFLFNIVHVKTTKNKNIVE